MKWPRFIISVAIPLTAGSIAGIVTSRNVNTWYPQLNKPSFNPPNWLFGPVWTILYIMMGISLYLLWTKSSSANKSSGSLPDQSAPHSFTTGSKAFAPITTSPAKQNAIILFFIQLALNFIWSFLFFQWHLIGWALVDICLLWLSIIVCLRIFPRISKPATWLFVPYLLWVSFATVLNAAIYMLN